VIIPEHINKLLQQLQQLKLLQQQLLDPAADPQQQRFQQQLFKDPAARWLGG
jgi:hypothetical protein